MCDYVYGPDLLCLQVTFEELQLCNMPLSLVEGFAKDTKLLNIPQQIKNFPKQRCDVKFPEVTYKPIGSYAWAGKVDQEKYRLINFHSDLKVSITAVSSSLSIVFHGLCIEPMLII